MGSARIDMQNGTSTSRNWAPKRRTTNEYRDSDDNRLTEAYSRKSKYPSWKQVPTREDIDDFADDRDEYR